MHGDSSGYQDINSAYLIINSGFAAVSACYVRWTAAGFSLLNDAASGWLGPIAAGSAATVQNSQCVLNAATSSASGSGNNRVVSYGITFLSGFAGTKDLYPFAIGAAGSSPYQSLGTWTVAAAVPITFQSIPSGRALQIDATPCNTPCTIQLSPGPHTVDASVGQNPPTGTQYNFTSWSDGGAAAHTITTTSSSPPFTAYFGTKYYLTTAVSPAGSGVISQSDSTGWYSSGTQAAVTANANAGYQFTGFSGTNNSTNNPLTITMNGPANETASFTLAVPSMSVTPPSGTGASQIFTGTYIDPVAYGQVSEARLLINASTATASACYVKWTSDNHFYLRNDADSAWVDGTTAAVQNSQCRLDSPANSVGGVGQTLTVNFGLTFFSAFSGAKFVYLTLTNGYGTPPWQSKGTWTVDMFAGDFTVSARTPGATATPGGVGGIAQYQYDVRALGAIDGSKVRVQNGGVVIPSTPPCLATWDQQSGWDPASRTGTVTLWIQTTPVCASGFTFHPEITWSAGGATKLTTDTTLTVTTGPTVSVTITPSSSTLKAGQSVRLTPRVTGTSNESVSWSYTPSNLGSFGQDGSDGVYVAPGNISSTQWVTITVTSQADVSKHASATIRLDPPAPINLTMYTVSGRITQPDGSGLGPMTVELSGDQSRIVSTDANGNYSIALPAGHYAVKPSSTYGKSSTSAPFDLLTNRTGQNYDVKPFGGQIAAEEDPPYIDVREIIHVIANGQPIQRDFYWTDSIINSRDIQSPGCWIKQLGGSSTYSARDQSVAVSYTADSSGPHFVATFNAPLTVSPGFRDMVCRYRDKDIVGEPIISIDPPAGYTIKLTSVTWAGAFKGLMKDSVAVGGWSGDSFESNGTRPIGVMVDSLGIFIALTPVWVDPNGDGHPTVKDPVLYTMGSKPRVASATIKILPATSTSVVVRIVAEPPELKFDDKTVNFDTDGLATTSDFPSTISIDRVHNQDYTLNWYASFDGGVTFQPQPFAVSMQRIFVSFGDPQKIIINGQSQGAATAKRIDYATRAAEGKRTIMVQIVNGTRTNGIAEAVIVELNKSPGFGNVLFGALLSHQEGFWSALDSRPPSDCLALAGLGAFVLAQLGIVSSYDVAYPVPLTAPDVDASKQYTAQVPPQFQGSNPSSPLLYTLVYYSPGAPPYPNEFEGFLQVDDGSGVPRAYTVGPPRGPIPATTCNVTPDTPQKRLYFNVINWTLLGLVPSGAPQLWWIDRNLRTPRAPDVGPISLPRSGCQTIDITYQDLIPIE